MYTSIRCTKCGKLSPNTTTKAAKEHTCVFCGAIIPPQTTTKYEEATKDKKTRRFPIAQSEAKPVNKNQRKPML